MNTLTTNERTPVRSNVQTTDRSEALRQARRVVPPVDVLEDEDEVLLVVDLPGVAPEDLNVHVDGTSLRIEARRGKRAEGTALLAEIPPYDFERSFKLTTGIDTTKISVELKHGVARVHLPKVERLKPRTIPVKAG